MKPALFFAFFLAFAAQAEAARHFNSPGAQHYFATASPEEKAAFLLAMPKGGDLDEEISGSVYAESMIGWAAKKGLCLDESLALSPPPCSAAKPPVKGALSDADLYRRILNAWSMRNVDGMGRDHFFSAFGKFEPALRGMEGAMLAELLSRAAREHVLYIEVALAPDGAFELGKRLGWDGNFQNTLGNLKNNGLSEVVAASLKEVKLSESEKNRRLKCGTPNADPGCRVAASYLYEVSGSATPGEVFSELATGFELASMDDSGFSGVLVSGPEDESMKDFSLHMQMLDFLKSAYPKAHIAINAGELSKQLVPPEGLSFHISEAVMLGQAARIGQGADIMHEVPDLLGKLGKKGVLLDVCPGRIRAVLGKNEDLVPLYLKHGVAVAISSCDAGLLRSEISTEYLKSAIENNLNYADLRNIARNSLEHAFVPGKSLWLDDSKFTPVKACARDLQYLKASPPCQSFLDASRKARLQWQFEAEIRDFEKQY